MLNMRETQLIINQKIWVKFWTIAHKNDYYHECFYDLPKYNSSIKKEEEQRK